MYDTMADVGNLISINSRFALQAVKKMRECSCVIFDGRRLLVFN